MDPLDPDAAYLRDMLTAAQDAQRFVASVTWEQYQQDRLRQLAVERSIEIIGEAARKVSEAFQAAHPEIPWGRIIAQRHVLDHEYGNIDHEKIWEVATVRLPELIAQLAPLIPPPPRSPEE